MSAPQRKFSNRIQVKAYSKYYKVKIKKPYKIQDMGYDLGMLVQRALQENKPNIVLDMQQIDQKTKDLGTLTEIHHKASQNRVSFCLVNVSPYTENMINITRLANGISRYPSRQEYEKSL